MSHYFTNEELPSKLEKRSVNILDKSFTFYIDNGVFSKKGLDFGSRSLIMTLLKCDLSGDVLDLGCGYGPIGIILSSFFDINVDMVDVNKRAVHLATMNVSLNKVDHVNVFYSDCYSNVNKKYDVIVTNPPIRAGKDIVYKFLVEAKDYLKPNGSLYFVINKDQGAKSTVKMLSNLGKISILEKNKGFWTIKCNF